MATEPCGDINCDLREISGCGDRREDNLLIHAEALTALDALTCQPRFAWRYTSKVKVAYLDPPFNTGSNFSHYRDRRPQSVWISMLRDTLDSVKQVLSDDGSVWVHLNDVEQHHARSVLDEVFGPENFIATIIWDKTPGPRPNANPIAIRHEYIHVYRKSRLFTVNERLDSVWSYKDVGAGLTAAAESRRLFPQPFSTPKPEQLLARIISATTDPGDIVLDCFAGSGTAAAVAHKLGRRWVAIEAEENTVHHFLVPRLTHVIDGTDKGGISAAVGWAGGGGFTVATAQT